MKKFHLKKIQITPLSAAASCTNDNRLATYAARRLITHTTIQTNIGKKGNSNEQYKSYEYKRKNKKSFAQIIEFLKNYDLSDVIHVMNKIIKHYDSEY